MVSGALARARGRGLTVPRGLPLARRKPTFPELRHLADVLERRRLSLHAGSLEHARKPLEPRLGAEHRAPRLAELAGAERRVAVAVGAQVADRVVDVKRAEPIAADDRVELVDRRVQLLGGRDLVPGGVEMAGVEADA